MAQGTRRVDPGNQGRGHRDSGTPALGHYYDHLNDMRQSERERDHALHRIRERTEHVREEVTDVELLSQ